VGGFVRKQYSIWHRVTTATFTWNEMLQLRAIHPRGILATVLRCLEMFHIPDQNIFVVTNDIRLGGMFSPTLIGPTLAGLAQGMGMAPLLPWPNGPGDSLPFRVWALPRSLNPNNWHTPVCLHCIVVVTHANSDYRSIKPIGIMSPLKKFLKACSFDHAFKAKPPP